MAINSMKNPRNSQTQDCTHEEAAEDKFLTPVSRKWISLSDGSHKHVRCDAYKRNKTNQMSPNITRLTVKFKDTLKARSKTWHRGSMEMG